MRIFDRYWWDGPKMFVAFLFGALVIDSVSAVWGERRPVGGFFEEFIARAMTFGLPIAAIFAGAWGGMKVNERTQNIWLGWIVGIAASFCIGVGGFFVLEQIPGVGWRAERLQDAMDAMDGY